jgi:hypothetical protein
MVLVAAKEEGGERRVLARAKSNIADDDGGIAYGVELATIQGGIETTCIVWNGAVEGTARQILGDVEQFDDSADVSEKAHAERFLRDLLSAGPVPAQRVKADADGAGYSIATIRRAQKSLTFRRCQPALRAFPVTDQPACGPPSAWSRISTFPRCLVPAPHRPAQALPLRVAARCARAAKSSFDTVPLSFIVRLWIAEARSCVIGVLPAAALLTPAFVCFVMVSSIC